MWPLGPKAREKWLDLGTLGAPKGLVAKGLKVSKERWTQIESGKRYHSSVLRIRLFKLLRDFSQIYKIFGCKRPNIASLFALL